MSNGQHNVFGEPIEICSLNPTTGFFRTGCCHTGPEDVGKARGNDLSTPLPDSGSRVLGPDVPRKGWRPPSQITRLRCSFRAGANARQHYERYLARAREAQLAGDAVEMENCYQHAEHYFRVLRGEGHERRGHL